MAEKALIEGSANFTDWITTYQLERSKYPSWINVHIEEPIRENAEVAVYVHPAIDARDRLGCFQEPRYHGGYELPICQFGEKLSSLVAGNLMTALSIIRELQGIKNEEALAYMTQIFLFVIDHLRSNKGLPSILFGPTWGKFDLDIPEEKAKAEKFMNTPRFPLSALLKYWNHLGGKYSRGFVRSPEGKCGQPSYLMIPPRWMTIDDLKKIYGEEYPIFKVPVLVDHTMIPLVKKLPEISSVLNVVMSAPQSDSVPKLQEVDRFPELPNLRWEEVSIAFLTHDSLKVQARDISKIFMFSNIGFRDKRKGNLPDTRWEILRDDFAGNSGVVTHGNRKTAAKLQFKKAVQEINSRLKQIVGIKENPVFYDKKEKAYKTKFKITDDIPYPYSPPDQRE